jgi:hypothetical protein
VPILPYFRAMFVVKQEKASIDGMRDGSIKWQLILGGGRTVNKALTQALELEAMNEEQLKHVR